MWHARVRGRPSRPIRKPESPPNPIGPSKESSPPSMKDATMPAEDPLSILSRCLVGSPSLAPRRRRSSIGIVRKAPPPGLPFQSLPFEPDHRKGLLPFHPGLSTSVRWHPSFFIGAKHDDVRKARAFMASYGDAGRRSGSKHRSCRSVVDEDGVEDTLGALAVRRMMRGEWLLRCRSDGTRTIRRWVLQVDARQTDASIGR